MRPIYFGTNYCLVLVNNALTIFFDGSYDIAMKLGLAGNLYVGGFSGMLQVALYTITISNTKNRDSHYYYFTFSGVDNELVFVKVEVVGTTPFVGGIPTCLRVNFKCPPGMFHYFILYEIILSYYNYLTY